MLLLYINEHFVDTIHGSMGRVHFGISGLLLLVVELCQMRAQLSLEPICVHVVM